MTAALSHEKYKTDCVSFTFEIVEDELRAAYESGDKKLIEKYTNLKNQGIGILFLCKGSDAPDYCLNIEIDSCEGCNDYRSFD